MNSGDPQFTTGTLERMALLTQLENEALRPVPPPPHHRRVGPDARKSDLACLMRLIADAIRKEAD